MPWTSPIQLAAVHDSLVRLFGGHGLRRIGKGAQCAAFALYAQRKQTQIVTKINSAQTPGSHGTTNVIALKAAIKALTCKGT